MSAPNPNSIDILNNLQRITKKLCETVKVYHLDTSSGSETGTQAEVNKNVRDLLEVLLIFQNELYDIQPNIPRNILEEVHASLPIQPVYGGDAVSGGRRKTRRKRRKTRRRRRKHRRRTRRIRYYIYKKDEIIYKFNIPHGDAAQDGACFPFGYCNQKGCENSLVAYPQR